MSTAEPPDEPGPPAAPPAPEPPPAEPGPPPAAAEPTDAVPEVTDTGATWSAATGTAPPVPPHPDPAPSAPATAAWPAAGSPPPPGDTIVPTTDGWSAPPPPPKRRLTWLWVLLGVLGVIAALVVVAVVLFVRTLAGPIDATNKVLAQIKAGQAATVERDAARHYQRAYALSCSKDRDVYTEEQYRQVFEATKLARGPLTDYDVNYSSVHGDSADVRYDLDFGRAGQERYEAVARKERGTWRVCLLTSGDD